VDHAEQSFEAAFEELQQTVAILEQGGLTLDEAIQHFERGMALAARCAQLLDQAELRVSRLLAPEAQPVEDGEPPF
jgi:exodeoxyribonuclease VII small subunit